MALDQTEHGLGEVRGDSERASIAMQKGLATVKRGWKWQLVASHGPAGGLESMR